MASPKAIRSIANANVFLCLLQRVEKLSMASILVTIPVAVTEFLKQKRQVYLAHNLKVQAILVCVWEQLLSVVAGA